MQIRIQSTGQVVQEGEFRALHQNTSLPQQLTESLINELGGDIVFEGPQAQPTRYQVAFADGVELINGKWFTKYNVADMEAEAIAAVDAAQAAAVRTQRNEKLNTCDWTQVADSPVDQAAWATYRQALRDISTQSGFPWEVTWPVAP